MPPDDESTVERIVREAMARDAAERRGFLDDACGDDEALRAEVAWLADAAEWRELVAVD